MTDVSALLLCDLSGVKQRGVVLEQTVIAPYHVCRLPPSRTGSRRGGQRVPEPAALAISLTRLIDAARS